MSALGDEEIAQEAKDVGIKMLLQKPFKTPEMIAALTQVCMPADDHSEEEETVQQDVDYLPYFRTSLQDNLKAMANLDCSFGETILQYGILESRGLAVIIGITGNVSGRVILDTSKEVACKLCGMINGEECDPEDSFVLISLAEFLNILSGNAISMINNMHKGMNLRLAPPGIFVGKNLKINSPKVKAEVIKVETTAGDIYLSVGFEGSW